MITFLTGKPGGGKTLYAVTELIRELRSTNRCVVTNMAIRLHPWIDGSGVPREGLKAVLQRLYHQDYDVEKRVHLLQDEQVKTFFMYRWRINYQGDVEQWQPVEKGDNRFRVEGAWGCFYIIDEVHEFFGTRNWKETGSLALSWASQSRRSGDDAILISQACENVDVALRRVSQECIWVINHRHLAASIFRQPDMITFGKYAQTPPKKGDSCLHRGRLKYDKRDIFSSYDTAAGVGVAGKGADIGKRARGLHWAWFPLFGLGALLAVMFGYKALQSHVIPMTGKLVQFGSNVSKMTNSALTVMSPPGKRTMNAPTLRERKEIGEITGYGGITGRWSVFTSEGKIIRGRHLVDTREGIVVLDGVAYTLVEKK